MTKTKIILIAVALSLVVMAAVGITFAQYVDNQNTLNNRTSQGYTGNYGFLSPNSGYGYSHVPQQGAYPYRTSMGMGMMGRFW